MYDSAKTPFNKRINNTYENSALDTYCNSTFYNSLSTAIQNAIIEKTFAQDSWYINDKSSSGGSGNPIYQGIYPPSNYYRLGLKSAAVGNSITRKCYAPSIQDIIDYLNVTPAMTTTDTTLTSTNIYKMLWNQTAPNKIYIWLRSADTADSSWACAFNTYKGNFSSGDVAASSPTHPVFQIDLLKIDYTVE